MLLKSAERYDFENESSIAPLVAGGAGVAGAAGLGGYYARAYRPAVKRWLRQREKARALANRTKFQKARDAVFSAKDKVVSKAKDIAGSERTKKVVGWGKKQLFGEPDKRNKAQKFWDKMTGNKPKRKRGLVNVAKSTARKTIKGLGRALRAAYR